MPPHNDTPRRFLPRGFRVSELPELLPQYSGDFGTDNSRLDPDHRSVHMAFAIAVTNVDQYHAGDQGIKADTLDALAQAWRAVTPDEVDVRVDYTRTSTSIDIERTDEPDRARR